MVDSDSYVFLFLAKLLKLLLLDELPAAYAVTSFADHLLMTHKPPRLDVPVLGKAPIIKASR